MVNPSPVSTTKQALFFPDLGPRQVVADFSGGTLTSDAGLLFLRLVDAGLGLTRKLATCFCDQRDERFVEHSVRQLLAQRIYAVGLGYEDLNDHAELRRDPLLATACNKTDPLGLDRFNPLDRGIALAAPATLNRMELSNHKETRGHKLPHDPVKVADCLLDMGVRCLPKYTQEVVLDLDAMGHLLHGAQEGKYYSDYYGGYCYLPLYIFAGDIPLWSQLRTCDRDGADGVVPALTKIVAAIRQRCKRARLIVRGDSGFCREEIMAFCEAQKIYYCIGLGRNPVLLEKLAPALVHARMRYSLCGANSVREFAEFEYQTQKSWSRSRRVIGKAEVVNGENNPRFIVTNLPAKGFTGEEDRLRFTTARLYEEFYCARGQMENVLKQQVLDLKADTMSTHYLGSNQLRLWLASFAYLLVERVRTLGLHGTALAQATAGTIRLKLFKVAAQVSVSVRRVYIQLSSAYPREELFRLCHARLMRLALADG
jgi:hypothetical protein